VVQGVDASASIPAKRRDYFLGKPLDKKSAKDLMADKLIMPTD
jgi:hypothetical protein